MQALIKLCRQSTVPLNCGQLVITYYTVQLGYSLRTLYTLSQDQDHPDYRVSIYEVALEIEDRALPLLLPYITQDLIVYTNAVFIY